MLFKQKQKKKTLCETLPQTKHRHLINYILIRQKDISSVIPREVNFSDYTTLQAVNPIST